MGILIITKSFPPKIDGVGHYAFHLWKALQQKLGIDKIFIATSFQKGNRNNKNFFYFYKWNIGEFKALDQYIKEHHIDYVLFQYVPYSFNGWGIPLLLGYKLNQLQAKKIITFHEIAIGYESISLKGWLIATLQRLIAWRLAFLADAVITSTGLYFKMLRLFSKRIFRVGIGSNFLLKEEVNIEKTEDIKLKITSFSNRITSTVLAAVKILISKGFNIQLIGVGKIPNDRQLLIERQVKELELEKTVYLTGILNETELLQILTKSDFYLQIEHVDKNGNGGISLKSGALAVAMSCGLPIITTKGKMTDMAVLRDRHEVLYTLGTSTEIAASIQVLISDIKLLKTLKEFSYRYYYQNLRWEVITDQYLSILQAAEV